MRDKSGGFGAAVTEGKSSTRSLLYALPLLTVAVVSYALFVVGTTRPFAGARVFGGPTEGAQHLSLRVSAIESYRGIESPLDVTEVLVEARLSDGRAVSNTAAVDERGSSSVVLEFAGKPVHGSVHIRVSSGASRLADGEVELSTDEWTKRARDLGGWLAGGSRSGSLTVQVAPGRAAMAVPFEKPLLVEVQDGARPVDGAEITLEPDGVSIRKGDEKKVTDRSGRAIVFVTPREHIVSLRVKARAGKAQGSWFGRLPIVPGALDARLEDNALVVESPVPQDLAYWSVIGKAQSIARGSVKLGDDGRARVPLSNLPSGPLWAMVSGEPELDSASTVGWPLGDLDPDAEPLRSRVVVDPLLLDGTLASQVLDARRRNRARLLAVGFTILAALLAGILLMLENRRSRITLEAHLLSAGEESESRERITDTSGRGYRAIVVLLCVALGFAVVALLALHRID